MKKAILFFSIGFAVLLNAAAMNWSYTATSSGITGASGSTISSYVVYLVHTDGAAPVIGTDFSSQFASGGILSVVNNTTQYEPNKNESQALSATMNAGQSYSFYAIIFDAATLGDAKNYWISDAITASAYDPETTLVNQPSIAFGGRGGDVAINPDASSWKAVTIPEPTVLALLALGVAGLALKRKNA